MLGNILAILLIVGFLFSVLFFDYLVISKYKNDKLDKRLLLLIILPANISYILIIVFILLILFR